MPTKNRGLGKGMDALFITELDRELVEEDRSKVKLVNIKDVSPNQEQPRKHFNDEALIELAASVKRHGILQPLIVTSHKGGYQIVAGERRWRAASKAGLKEIPVIVRSLEELEKLEIGLIENVQRVDLSPLEQALSIYKLHQQFSIDYNEIAERLGKASTTVSNIVRLLQLPEAAAEALRKDQITEGHARAILALSGKPELQAELLQKIIAGAWTVRQAEAFASQAKQGRATQKAKPSTKNDERLSKKLNLPVIIKKQKRGGQLIIHFKNDSELERINKLIG